ncbi:VanW family protein, partial [Candidatus Woesebacteria bacterium]|nr:VanW family protein [Candidatus Woesebacteria bacterium]
PPGYDATVYAPSVDFRFTNDTEHAIVLSTEIDVPNRHLVVKIWGTSDGRTSEISDYRQWNQRPAPAPLYQDDPTLPRGTVKQVDWASPGLNTSFQYTVTNADGSERYQREFTSYFRPWQAVYLVGTGG